MKNHKLTVPKGKLIRPTSEKLRQAVFNICQHQVENAIFLDVFAGSGAMGIEALSRGAQHATFIENQRVAVQAIKENLTCLHLVNQATVLYGEALLILKQLTQKGQTFDLIFVDPPYGQKVKGSTQTTLDAALALIDQSSLLRAHGTLFLEESCRPTISLAQLTLEKERRVGNSHLYQYVKRFDT